MSAMGGKADSAGTRNKQLRTSAEPMLSALRRVGKLRVVVAYYYVDPGVVDFSHEL
jgi:hypothetical protein